MWKNYLVIGFRHLVNKWKYSLINLIGLAVGLAACILISLYIHREWQFDQFHEFKDDLYRITAHETDDGLYKHTAYSYHPLKPRLDESLPKGSKTTRYLPQSLLVKNGLTNETRQEPSFVFVDSTFFELFTFSPSQGDLAIALQDGKGIVLTQSCAQRLFGRTNPIGQILELEGKFEVYVSAVVADPPANSSLQFDFLAPLSMVPSVLRPGYFHPGGSWYYPPIYTFAYIPDKRFVAEWPEYQKTWRENHLPSRVQDRYVFDFQPIANMHFQSLEADIVASIKPIFLWILLLIAGLVLGMACINYINLSVGQLVKRFSEIGIRKVLGAANSNLLHQMVVEALLFLAIGMTMAAILVQLGLPAFNNLTSYSFSILDIFQQGLWAYLAIALLILSCLIAAFPYFALKQQQIIRALKHEGNSKSFGKYHLKDVLVITQFSVAIALVAATIIIQSQTSFLMNKDLGFSPQQILVIPIRDEKVQSEYLVVKQRLLAQTGIKSVSAISNFPWEGGFYDFPSKFLGAGAQKEVNLPTFLVDPDFITTMNIELQEGRNFYDRIGKDAEAAFLINEAAQIQLDIQNIDDYRIQMNGVASGPAREGNIIGVAKNFYLKSLHNPIDPLVIAVAPESYYLDNFVVQVETDQLSSTLANLSHTWAEVIPDRPLDYFFLDDTFENLYRKEQRMYGIFKTFSLLAIFIAFLGLYALASLTTSRRVKEIGVRKILGATPINIIKILSADFLKLVGLSFLIATPICWYSMHIWLESFAHRIDVTWWIFLLSGLIAMGITLLVVGYQALRAALINPIHSLRTE